jgi:hypothetical protein
MFRYRDILDSHLLFMHSRRRFSLLLSGAAVVWVEGFGESSDCLILLSPYILESDGQIVFLLLDRTRDLVG